MNTAWRETDRVEQRKTAGKYFARTCKNKKKRKYGVVDRSHTEKKIVPDVEKFGEIIPFDAENFRDKQPGYRRYRFIKRAADIILSSLALVVLSPVMLVTAAIICIDDPHAGPIFAQERVGKNGVIFKVYKFRSMRKGAQDEKADLIKAGYDERSSDDPISKLGDNDPRITRVGHFIRKTSIDELPQLINVIKGEMSIVGPRPLETAEVEKFDDFSMQRYLMRPGLSCYWQSSRNRDKIHFNDWMKMDVRYIQHCNLWEDIKIIFKTFGVVFTANGS